MRVLLGVGKCASVALLVWLAGCSQTLDFNECAVDSDCRQFGVGLVCNEDAFCVVPDEEAPNNDTEGCQVDADCADQAPRTSCQAGQCVEPVDPPNNQPNNTPNNANNEPPECTTTRCVDAFGPNHICDRNGECVNALTPECNKVVGPLERDDALIIGSILPTQEFADIGLPIQQAAELAVEEINTVGGLPGGRRLVLIGCDSSGDSDKGRTSAEHLTDVLGVPALIGPAFSTVYIDVATDVTIPGGVMSISPSATTPLITGLADEGLAWRTVASDLFQGIAISDLVRDTNYERVVAFNKGEAYGRGLSDKVNTELVALGEEGLFVREYANPAEQAPDFGAIVNEALDAMPDAQVVLLLGTSEVIELIELYEIAVSERGLIPPRYILTDGGKSPEKWVEMLGRGQVPEDLLTRIEGTEPDHQFQPHYDNFDLRYRRRFGAPAQVFSANAYDATYILAYAIATLPTTQEPTGQTVAKAVDKLIDGQRIEVGPNDISDALNALQAGGSINFEGASGPLDFDTSLGEAPANVARWNIQERDNGQIRFFVTGSYVIADDGTGTWTLD